MRAYPARFISEPEGGFTVTFRDVPEAITWGEDRPEALSMAGDALETALSTYVDRRLPLPRATKLRRAEALVPLSALGAAKAALYETMRRQGVGKAELARRLDCHLPQIDRLLDLCHSSKLEQVESALAALGKRLLIGVRDAA
ncbi:MAG: type II toxin-antitoxin system HicB family antitoxin [Rhodospirillales bacterium]|nr:type II toxin-antitoxin system HicB family antitoxin [Rhodospirillales bacterium]